jgi:molybdate transport system substrate-binding protein
VGSLPDELQKLTVFSAGVFAASAQSARAAALIAALASPDVTAVMRHKGLEPMASVV